MRPFSRIERGDLEPALALVYAAVLLTVLEYGFFPPYVEARLSGVPLRALPPPSLAAGLIWAAGCVVGYALLPALLVLLVHRRPLSGIGYRWGGLARHLWIYFVLYLVMLPVLWVVSRRQDFLSVYPFVHSAARDWTHFWVWEAAYLAQFVALESFFRGYLLFTLERRIGAALAVAVMVVPYCMIHYHKPPLEALGAIGAGLVLGVLALWLRSWYGGAVLHGLVALTMDGLAAHRAGLF